MARFELVEFGLACEQRRQANDFASLHVAQIAQAANHAGQKLGLGGFFAAQRRAACYEQVRVFRANGVLVIEVQGFAETFVQLREVLKRAAKQGDVSANGAPAC